MRENSLRRTEVRIGGFGGQGIVLAGVLLGRAALDDGRHAVQNQSYGAEARGGAARSEVIVADGPIVYPEVVAPDILVCLSQAALDRYLKDLRPEGVLVVDAELVAQVPHWPGRGLCEQPFTAVAERELGRAIAANMVMLGFVAALTGVVGLPALKRAVAAGAPAGTEALNLRAVERGAEMAGVLV